MVGTVRMKKKGWIRETWPRENCRDPVAHLNRKGASGERGWAGWRIRLPATAAGGPLSPPVPESVTVFPQPHSSLTLCLLSTSRMSKGKGSGRPSGPGPVFRDQGGNRTPWEGGPILGEPRFHKGAQGVGEPIKKGLKYQAALGPFSAVNSFQSLSCVRLCDPMDYSTPGLPVYHQLPEFTQTHIH